MKDVIAGNHREGLSRNDSGQSDGSRRSWSPERVEFEKSKSLNKIYDHILEDINNLDYSKYTDVLKNINIVRRYQKIEGFMEEQKDPLADFMEEQKENLAQFMKGYKHEVAQFIGEHKDDIINYIRPRIDLSELRVEGETISAKSNVAFHLRNFIYLEYERKKDKNLMKIVAWLDYQKGIYDLKKKHFATSGNGHNSTEVLKEKEERERNGDPSEVASKENNEIMNNQNFDKTGEITTPQTKPESKFRKIMRKALKRIWDVMKRPIKFVARKTLDGIAFVPYKLVRLTAKGTWHEMRKHPVKFTAIMVGLNIMFSAGILPYLLWLARNQHRREKQAREGTQAPSEKRSWPALAHALQSYEGRYQNKVNKMGDTMLKVYGRLENKDKSKKSDTDDPDGTSDSPPKRKSKREEGSGTDGQGGTSPSSDMPGDQASQTPSEDIPPRKPEGSQIPISVPVPKRSKDTKAPKNMALLDMSNNAYNYSRRRSLWDAAFPQSSTNTQYGPYISNSWQPPFLRLR